MCVLCVCLCVFVCVLVCVCVSLWACAHMCEHVYGDVCIHVAHMYLIVTFTYYSFVASQVT